VIDELAQRFPHPDVRFSRKDRLVLVEVTNEHGTAALSPFGATLLSYIPRGGAEVIWVSETARFDGRKPIRGGVPVCWPWFGPHPSDPDRKAHGIARGAPWTLESVRSVDAGTEVALRLAPDAVPREAWPHDFALRLVVTLGPALEMRLEGENRSHTDWTVSEALHAYFRVAEATETAVEGLQGKEYADKLRDGARSTQDGPLQVAAPMDRVYLDHQGPAVLHDAGNGRRIRVTKAGSASTIVWNPGPAGARDCEDMPDDGYRTMVCVEAGNALDKAYTLPAGAHHTLTTRIAVE
jgi:glucose-6-phosphate 1-epimerase